MKIFACHVEGLGLIPSLGAILNNQYFLSDQTRISSFLLRNYKEVVRNTTPWVTVTICYQIDFIANGFYLNIFCLRKFI